MSLEAQERQDHRIAGLLGPALLLAELAFAAILYLQPAASLDTLFWWTAYGPIAPERSIPILALGLALGLVGWKVRCAALIFAVAGFAVGVFGQVAWLNLLALLPAATAHDFYVGPVSSIVAGLALICGMRLRPVVTPIAAFLLAALWALWINLLDPTMHDLKITLAGIAVALAVLGAVTPTVLAYRRPWMFVAAPIGGSWLVAIGLLYGGTYLATKPVPLTPPPPPAKTAPDPGLMDGLFPTQGQADGQTGSAGNDLMPGGEAKPF
ncbi:hypothetical protein LQ948_03480 [Jiella sp. MQZ9-1]|uniref:Uncharacterized protein n=1 Tax=Jiella flava TaxID=2816857 RepID=A0A939JUP2_9HYPH|nr:hypothetical protein [Jiella flava]MBO0661624.1 hypothetical protein [Jiella flava]MCD2470266.1 hypothetical protein [Jiella flava]